MKNFWNIFLLSTATLAITTLILIFHFKNKKIEPIAYDANIEKEVLNLCDANGIKQYYSVDTAYNGGKRAIKKKLLPMINEKSIFFDTKNGNIAIRFIVNCHGEIGLFRAKGTDETIAETDFDTIKIGALISLISQLDDWQIKDFGTEKYDSYYFINFKIKNGYIIDIF